MNGKTSISLNKEVPETDFGDCQVYFSLTHRKLQFTKLSAPSPRGKGNTDCENRWTSMGEGFYFYLKTSKKLYATPRPTSL